MFSASCHCGAVRIRLARRPRKLTQCNCSICRRYGALWAYYRRRSVEVVAAPGAVARYAWRNRTLTFNFCRICGCVTHHERTRARADGNDTCGVNLRNIDEPALIADLPVRMLDGARSWRVLHEHRLPTLLCSPAPARR